jgi:hypothetical protein
MTDTDRINETANALMAAGYRLVYSDNLSKGWVIIPGDPRYGVRLGDPKPIPAATVAALEYRQYVSGLTCTE